MIDWLIEVSLRNRFLVVAFFLLLGGWGYWALLTTPIDAIPDLSDNQVIVFTDWPGRSPQEVEDQVTYPLTVSLQGLPGVRVVRSSSAFGFSMINVIFEDDVDLYFARSRVLERLNLLAKALPAGVVPTLGPDATGVGHVFWYTVEGTRLLAAGPALASRTGSSATSSTRCRAWPRCASVGGVVRQYQVDVDPNRLRAYRIPLSAVVDAVMRSNRNVGGNVVESSGHVDGRARPRPDRERRAIWSGSSIGADERRADLRAPGRRREDRRRLPRRRAREGHRGGGRRRRRGALRRQHRRRHRRASRRRSRRSRPACRPACDRAVLRPLGAHRAGGGDAPAGAHRGDDRRHASSTSCSCSTSARSSS